MEKRHVLAPFMTKSPVSASSLFTSKLKPLDRKTDEINYSYCLEPRYAGTSATAKGSVNYYRFDPFVVCVATLTVISKIWGLG